MRALRFYESPQTTMLFYLIFLGKSTPVPTILEFSEALRDDGTLSRVTADVGELLSGGGTSTSCHSSSSGPALVSRLSRRYRTPGKHHARRAAGRNRTEHTGRAACG